MLGNTLNQETVTVVAVSGKTLTLASPLKSAHGAGEPIARTGGNLPLPGSRAAAGRLRCSVQPRGALRQEQRAVAHSCRRALRLGPVAEGTAHRRTDGQAFYGSPLVAWTPALGATVYEVQWSKKRYPFKPEPNPQNAERARARSTLGTSDGPAAQARHVVLPRARLQLRTADRRAADVLVGPRQDRRRETEVPRRRPRQVAGY